MYQGYRFSFRRSVWWTRHSIAFVTVYSAAVCSLFFFTVMAPLLVENLMGVDVSHIRHALAGLVQQVSHYITCRECSVPDAG